MRMLICHLSVILHKSLVMRRIACNYEMINLTVWAHLVAYPKTNEIYSLSELFFTHFNISMVLNGIPEHLTCNDQFLSK